VLVGLPICQPKLFVALALAALIVAVFARQRRAVARRMRAQRRGQQWRRLTTTHPQVRRHHRLRATRGG
jgi:hypothetical protein